MHQHQFQIDTNIISPESPPISGSQRFRLSFNRTAVKKWPNSEQLVKEFNAELAKFVATGQRKKIYDKYRIVSGLGQ